MPNPKGNPSGGPPSELTLEYGPREKLDMRWPQKIIARVDRRAAELTLEEGSPVSRTEYTLRAVLEALERDAVPETEWVRPPAPEVSGKVAEQEACPHPRDARRQLGYLTRCGICGKRMDR